MRFDRTLGMELFAIVVATALTVVAMLLVNS